MSIVHIYLFVNKNKFVALHIIARLILCIIPTTVNNLFGKLCNNVGICRKV